MRSLIAGRLDRAASRVEEKPSVELPPAGVESESEPPHAGSARYERQDGGQGNAAWDHGSSCVTRPMARGFSTPRGWLNPPGAGEVE